MGDSLYPMQGILRLVASLAVAMFLIAWSAAPARADDVSAAGRGVVRVVTIAVVGDEVVGFGSGSGFAVAPNRIVTNAHVVELAQRYPGNVVIGVVPSEGNRSYQGRLIAIDTARDLALIEFTGTQLPALTLYGGPIDDGATMIALGYPANVDLATARSASDFINPLAPVRSQGSYSGLRELQGTHVVLHTAAIAHGNSGGPLLDPCGRVLGVNSALTRGDDGDASFAFAIADDELQAFLRQAGQTFQVVGTPCVPLAQQLERQRSAEEQAAAAAAEKQRQMEAKADAAHAAALEAERDRVNNARENYVFMAVVLLVLGAAALGATGLFVVRNQRNPAIIAGAVGGVLIVAAILCFFLRPDFDPDKVKDASVSDGPTPAPSATLTGKLVCSVQADQSRITVSSTNDVSIDWQPGGCINGRTQYADTGQGWERILVPNTEQTVSVLDYDPASATYTNTRYLMPADAMTKARQLRSTVTLKSCTKNDNALAGLANQQSQIRQALPASYNEKIVYHCRSAE